MNTNIQADTRILDVRFGDFVKALKDELLHAPIPTTEEYIILRDTEGKLGEPGKEYKFLMNELVDREQAMFITGSDTTTLTRWLNADLIKPYGAGKVPKYKVSDLLKRKANKRKRKTAA